MRLIDADELRELFAETIIYIAKRPDMSENLEYMIRSSALAIKMIDDQPTVDAVPVKHGKWVGTSYDGYADGYPVYDEWECSECGTVFEDEEPTYNYCPCCGARMDGRKEE